MLATVAGVLALIAAGPASADDCGNPAALGTSRTIIIDPTEHVRLGMMQYPETLPLADREVVLTFDDGPLPPYTTRALDILASECVKATFFLVGRMAKAYPDTVRKIHAAGHAIGTHSNTHPFTFHRMTAQQADAEVEGGIASVAAALGDRNAVAPFFRIPGLMRGDTVERYLAGRSLMTWSADFPADDWTHISANEIAKRALQRIEARGRGMLLLHDIQPATILALPTILRELKSRGYRIVHVEPTSPDRIKTATLPEQWLVRKNGRWPAPKLSVEVLIADTALPMPAPTSFGLAESFSPGAVVSLSRMRSYAVARGQIPLPPETPWPRLLPTAGSGADGAAERTELPAPSLSSFGYENDFAPMAPELAAVPRHAELPSEPAPAPKAKKVVRANPAAPAVGASTPTPPIRPPQAIQPQQSAQPQQPAHSDAPGLLRLLNPFRLANPM